MSFMRHGSYSQPLLRGIKYLTSLHSTNHIWPLGEIKATSRKDYCPKMPCAFYSNRVFFVRRCDSVIQFVLWIIYTYTLTMWVEVIWTVNCNENVTYKRTDSKESFSESGIWVKFSDTRKSSDIFDSRFWFRVLVPSLIYIN